MERRLSFDLKAPQARAEDLISRLPLLNREGDARWARPGAVNALCYRPEILRLGTRNVGKGLRIAIGQREPGVCT